MLHPGGKEWRRWWVEEVRVGGGEVWRRHGKEEVRSGGEG